MIDIRAARNDPEGLRAAVARKGAGEAFDALMEADRAWLDLVPQVDELRARTKLKGRPTPEQIEELKGVKSDLAALEQSLAEAAARRDELLAAVPNPPDAEAPDGLTEDDAVEIRRVGDQPSFPFEPRDHLELGRIDMERAARVSGSRFAYRIGDVALAELALYRYALETATGHGYLAVLPPVLVREEAMYGTGFFPTDAVNIYSVERDELYLTGTSEVALAALHMGEILDAAELPLRYAGFSTCFRREAGAAGKDTRGMFRVHQFDKVEMFVFCLPAESPAEHDRLLAIEEEIVDRPRRARGEEVRRRGVVPVPGPLPGDHLDLEHDRFPGPPARRPLPRRARRAARPHAERHRGDRPGPPRRHGELPAGGSHRRRAGGAAALRRAGDDQRAGVACPQMAKLDPFHEPEDPLARLIAACDARPAEGSIADLLPPAPASAAFRMSLSDALERQRAEER